MSRTIYPARALIEQARSEHWSVNRFDREVGCCWSTGKSKLVRAGVMPPVREYVRMESLGPEMPSPRRRSRRVVGIAISSRGPDAPEIGRQDISRLDRALSRMSREREQIDDLVRRAKDHDVVALIALRVHHRVRLPLVEAEMAKMGIRLGIPPTLAGSLPRSGGRDGLGERREQR